MLKMKTDPRMIISGVCSAAAIAGIVGTAVSAVVATPKAIDILDKAEREKGGVLDIPEKIKATWKTYIPTAVIGLSSAACIIGASVLGRNAQISAVGAYTAAVNAYEHYKLKNIETNGLEAHHRVLDALAAEKSRRTVLSACDCLGSSSLDFGDEEEEALFYDATSERYFTSTVNRVLQAEYHFNRNFTMRGWAFLNEFYEFLGIKPTDKGADHGFCMESGVEWVDFDHHRTTLEDGLEAHVIDILWIPERLDELIY